MDAGMLVRAMKNIYTVNLAVRPGERVFVFTDTITPDEVMDDIERARREGLVTLARAAAEAGRELGFEVIYIEYPSLGSPGSEPAEGVWRLAFGDAVVDTLRDTGLLDRLIRKESEPEDVARARAVVTARRQDVVDAVIALSNYSTSHTRFRDLMTSAAGTRYASMPLFEEYMLEGSMNVDWAAVSARCDAVAAGLEGGESVRVTTAAGTDIAFGINGREVMKDTGMLREPGSFSNLPAGEVFLAPVEGTAEGRLVIEWGPNRKLTSPITVNVRGGRAEEVIGDDPYVEELRLALRRAPDNPNIAELGIGTNDRAERPDNILETEKILGTVHIAFGDNTSFGGSVSTPFHQDFVFFGPTLEVIRPDGRRIIIENGRHKV